MTDKRDRKPDDPMAGIHWDLDQSMSYSQYLQLDKVLDAQKPLSGQHDEMLFILIHQASELWLKLCLHELSATRAQIRADDLEPAFKMLSRVARVQVQMIQSWDVLGTMTPADYMRFRDSLGPELRLPVLAVPPARIHARQQGCETHRGAFFAIRRITPCCGRELATPSLYDETIRSCWRGAVSTFHASARSATGRRPTRRIPAVEAAWLAIYRDSTCALGPVRTRRKARGSRVPAAAMALRAPEDGRAHHRLQARDRRLEPASATSSTC